MPLPSQIAKILTAPREAILNRVRVTASVHQTIDFTVPTVLHASFLCCSTHTRLALNPEVKAFLKALLHVALVSYGI